MMFMPSTEKPGPALLNLSLLMIAMAATLFACGGSSESEAPPAESPATEEPVAEEPAAEEPVAEETESEAPAAEETVTEEPAEETDEPAEEEAAAPSGDFTGVQGVAMIDGERPKRKAIRMSADPGCDAIHGDEKVGTVDALVTGDGQIKNVFVYVKNGAALGEVPVPTAPAKLDQVGCMYEPHLIGIRAEQPLDIVNSDPLAHNIHCLAEINREFNFGQPTPGTRQQTFRKPENAIKIKCDIHPWMGAYIFVMDHPYFAISDGEGKFSIPDLPAGTHTLVAWHETFGELETQVTVSAGGGATANFTFKN